MASYSELHNLITVESEIKNRVKVALLVAAKTVYDEDDAIQNHTERLLWARETLLNLESMTECAFLVLVAINKDAIIANIHAADDTIIQQAVDDHINLLAGV